MRRVLLSFVCLTLVLIGLCGPTAAKRVALVIGNGDYVQVAKLQKAVNDAWAMGAAPYRTLIGNNARYVMAQAKNYVLPAKGMVGNILGINKRPPVYAEGSHRPVPRRPSANSGKTERVSSRGPAARATLARTWTRTGKLVCDKQRWREN